MRIDTILKIKENKKFHEYLISHSYWYKLLNRNEDNLKLLIKEFKSYNRNVTVNKVNTAIDNAELLSNIVKMID